MKALEKDRTRRYETASALSQDIRRYLANEPISARPPSSAYRAGKFVRRNRLAVAMVSALLVALVAGVVGTGIGFVRERSQARRAQTVTDMLTNMLGKVDPNVAKGQDITVRQVLDELAKTIDEDFGNEPEIEAEVRATIGTMYYELGLYEAAEPHLEKAVKLHRRVHGAEHEATLNLLNRVAMNSYGQRRFDRATEIWEELVASQSDQLGAKHERTLTAKQNLATIYKNLQRFDEAERLFVDVLEDRRRVLGNDNGFTTATMNNLANLYNQTGRPEMAEPLYVEALAIRRRVLGNDHGKTLVSAFSLGNLRLERGDKKSAEALLREAYDGLETLYKGDNHEHTLYALHALALTLQGLGRLDEATTLAERSLRRHHKKYGTEAEDTIAAAALLVELFDEQQRTSDAAELRRQYGINPVTVD